MSKPLHTYEFASAPDTVLEIWPDPSPISPRENENLGVMIYNHRRYVLGDERISHSSFDDYLEAHNLDPDQVVSFPLYVYEHSGIHMSVDDFNDPWDSGCVGVIYTTFERIAQEYGEATPQTVEMARDLLRGEVEEFDQYISGEVYGFRLMQKNEVGRLEELESGWGFLGSDITQNGILSHLPNAMARDIDPSIAPSVSRPSL